MADASEDTQGQGLSLHAHAHAHAHARHADHGRAADEEEDEGEREINGGGGEDEDEDDDDDDEGLDFRLLSAFAGSKDQSSLPRRGDKDFEPHGSKAQASALDAARHAMHTALSHERVHQPKTHLRGILNKDNGTVAVANPKGLHFRTMGKMDRHGVVHLLPEEALFLLERGVLDVQWPLPAAAEDGQGGEAEATETDDVEGDQRRKADAERQSDDSAKQQPPQDLPLSLQAGYALLLDKQGLTLDRYLVYAGLRRSGYIVLRAPGWYPGQLEITNDAQLPSKPTPISWNFLTHILAKLTLATTAQPSTAHGPLVRPGLYRNYQDIYRRLALIPTHDPRSLSDCSSPLHPPLNSPSQTPLNPAAPPRPSITYHVYKPASSTFAKSRPGPPDFYISVLSARESLTLDMSALAALFDETPLPQQPVHANMYARLKRGWRSAVVAVVDAGVVSYTRFGDAGFAHEKLYENFGRERGNTGGGRRGKNAGRGKGQGQRGR